MRARLSTLPRPVRAVAVAAVVAGTAAVLALVAQPAAQPPPIADPREVLLRAAEAARGEGSAHYLAAIAGTVAVDPSGATEPIDLEGTTLEGDIALAAAGGDGAATATLTMTGLGKALETVIVGKDAWLRIGLLGRGWQRGTAAESPFAFLADPAAITSGLGSFLDDLPTAPRMEPEESCGETRCYVVTVELPSSSVPSVLEGLFGGLLSGSGGFIPTVPGGLVPGLSDGTLPLPSGISGSGRVRVSVERASLRPVRLRFLAEGGTTGRITVDVALTKWGVPAAIVAPGP